MADGAKDLKAKTKVSDENVPDDVASERAGETWTADEEANVVRKIDWRLMPLMTVAYMLQFLDKITLSNASIMGIREDLNLSSSEYSWASSVFYFGYLVAAYPASVGLAKLPQSKLISICIIIWGVILALHCVPHNFIGLAILRFLLGVFESIIFPGFSMIVSVWYKQSEHASRHGIWFAGNAGGSIIGSFVSFGIAHISSFAPWKVLFILYGSSTVAWGIVLLLLLPDEPSQARFLNSQEREIAISRTAGSQMDTRREYNMIEVKEALGDPHTWLIGSYSLLTCFPNGALTSFGNIVTKGFGFNTFNTLLLQLPSAISTILIVLLTGWLASRYQQIRSWLIISLLVLSIGGAIMVRQIDSSNKAARLVGMALFAKFSCGFPLVLSLIASNVAGQTKKTFVRAVFFVCYCVGNIAGPQVFIDSEAPGYPTAFATMIATLGLAVIILLALRLLLSRRNKSRNEAFGIPSEDDAAAMLHEGYLTDFQREKSFRYQY